MVEKMKQKICERICILGLLIMGIGVFCAFLSVTWMSYSYLAVDFAVIFTIVGGIVVVIASYFLN